MDDPIIRETGTATQYFHQDGLGSVVALSDQAGATVGTQRFDAWGNRLAGTGTIPQYGYTGREPDETGLVYYRARYYDPSIGRFTQRDPVGLQGGINQYAYVEGNPVNQTDPEGLVSVGSVQVADNTYFNNYGTDAGGTSVGSKLLQGTHYALDAVNLFADGPAALIGASAGVIDAGIYWLEGKKLDAGLSLAGAVPVVGIAATVGRYGGKAVDGAGSLIQANRAAGQVGENFLAKTYGGAQQVTKSTSLGTRVIDNLVDATAMESKVGRTSLTSTVRNQIAKDSELLMSPLSRVDAIEWHFFLGKTGLGPTAPLKKALEDALFKIEIH